MRVIVCVVWHGLVGVVVGIVVVVVVAQIHYFGKEAVVLLGAY